MGEKVENRRWVFEEAPVAQAVFTMAVPTIITQLINIVYNFADAWYVGRTGSASMMAALTVSLPVFIIIQALANLFGIGGASAISRALGAGNPRRARRVFTEDRPRWDLMVQRDMEKDVSWTHSARQYLELYDELKALG